MRFGVLGPITAWDDHGHPAAGAASGLLTAGPVQDYLTEAGSLLS